MIVRLSMTTMAWIVMYIYILFNATTADIDSTPLNVSCKARR